MTVWKRSGLSLCYYPLIHRGPVLYHCNPLVPLNISAINIHTRWRSWLVSPNRFYFFFKLSKPKSQCFKVKPCEAHGSGYKLNEIDRVGPSRTLVRSTNWCGMLDTRCVCRSCYSVSIFLFFRFIRAGSELTWDYGYQPGLVEGKVMYCYCGSSNCRGRLL